MKFDSQFFLAGASVLAVLFFVHGDWALLIVPILLMIAGIARHDLERARELDEDCARQLLDRPGTAMLPLDGFRGRGLMFYHGGQPVFRTLDDRDSVWCYAGRREDFEQLPDDWPVAGTTGYDSSWRISALRDNPATAEEEHAAIGRVGDPATALAAVKLSQWK